MDKLEKEFEIKIEAHLMSIEQYELILNQCDIIAKHNREMYAELQTKINSYKSSKALLEESTNAILCGPKPSWMKYRLGYVELNKKKP